MSSYPQFFKLLSDETRLRILMVLRERELCVCQMEEIFGLSQPKISKHLAKLREGGLVIDKRREQFVYYSINSEQTLLLAVLTALQRAVENSDDDFEKDRKRAERREVIALGMPRGKG